MLEDVFTVTNNITVRDYYLWAYGLRNIGFMDCVYCLGPIYNTFVANKVLWAMNTHLFTTEMQVLDNAQIDMYYLHMWSSVYWFMSHWPLLWSLGYIDVQRICKDLRKIFYMYHSYNYSLWQLFVACFCFHCIYDKPHIEFLGIVLHFRLEIISVAKFSSDYVHLLSIYLWSQNSGVGWGMGWARIINNKYPINMG